MKAINNLSPEIIEKLRAGGYLESTQGYQTRNTDQAFQDDIDKAIALSLEKEKSQQLSQNLPGVAFRGTILDFIKYLIFNIHRLQKDLLFYFESYQLLYPINIRKGLINKHTNIQN